MIKLQTGVSTDMDFIKSMKEKGQNVSAEFPAETLRKQFDEISENDITFNMTNESFLEEVANGDEPGPTPPTPTEKVTITLHVSGPECSDEPEARVGDEVIVDFPAELTEDAGTELPITVTCENCETYEGTLVFDEDKTVEIVLEPSEVTVTFKLSGVFVTNDEPKVVIDGQTELDFPFEITKPHGTELEYTASCEGYDSKTETVEFDRNKDVVISLDKAVVVEIGVTKLPSKTNYEFGESLDLTGIEVVGYHEDGSTERVDIQECTVSPSNVNEVPKTTIYINYLSTLNTSFEVNVSGGPVFQAHIDKSLEEYTADDTDVFFDEDELEVYHRMLDCLETNTNYEGKINFIYDDETTEFTGVFKKVSPVSIECYVDGVNVLNLGENSAFEGVVFTEDFHFINTTSDVSIILPEIGQSIVVDDEELYNKITQAIDEATGGREDEGVNIIVKTDKCYSGDYYNDSDAVKYRSGNRIAVVSDDSNGTSYFTEYVG